MLDKLLAAGASFSTSALLFKGRVVGRSTVDGFELFEDERAFVEAELAAPPAQVVAQEPAAEPAPKRGRKPKAQPSIDPEVAALIDELTAG